MILHFPLLIDTSKISRGDQEVLRATVLHHIEEIEAHDVPDQDFVKMFKCKMHVDGDLWDACLAYQAFKKDLNIWGTSDLLPLAYQMPERPEIIGG